MAVDVEDGLGGAGTPSRDVGNAEPVEGEHSLPPSLSRPSCTAEAWRVVVHIGERLVTRQVWYSGKPWFASESYAVSDKDHPAEIIWPTWPGTLEEENATSASPLADLRQHWDTATNRLRDSAKWMAAVLGAALASVIPTAPLANLGQQHLSPGSVALGLCGLLSVSVTLVLVLQVMRPQSVSYDQIQDAEPSSGIPDKPLYKWKNIIVQHPDLYLPCGVESLTGLRKLILVEELTLVALARAGENSKDDTHDKMSAAQAARAARLYELRAAAAGIVAIGVYYKVRARSTVATWGGVAFGLLGMALIVLAVSQPIK